MKNYTLIGVGLKNAAEIKLTCLYTYLIVVLIGKNTYKVHKIPGAV